MCVRVYVCVCVCVGGCTSVSVCVCVCGFWAISLSGPLSPLRLSRGNSLTGDPGLSLNSLSIKSCEMQIMKHLITTVREPAMKRGALGRGVEKVMEE